MSKIYYRAIAWIIPLSWVFMVWTLITFIIGGLQTNGEIMWDLISWGTYVVVFGGLEFLAFYLAPRVVTFYKWDAQSWWNYNADDVPDTWPSQLGEFVDY